MEIKIESHEELISAIVATLFTPKQVCEDTIIYDKESIYSLARLLDDVCQTWYNVDLSEANLDIKLERN